jgi:CHAD domain-containing protein
MALDLKRIKKSVKRVRKFIKQDRRRPTTKDIHDLRTSARRLESTLNALASNMAGKQKRLLNDLADARKSAGKVRDMDVLTAHALSLNLDDGEQDCLVQLIEYLGAKRDKSARKLWTTLRASGPRLRRELKRGFRQIEELITDADKNAGDSNAEAEVTAKALKLSSELSAPSRLNKNNLHPYRLKVKEVRYVLQLSDHADDEQFVEKLGEVKDAIGAWHDFLELSKIAADVLDHGDSCKVLQQLRSISDAKLEKALALSDRLRGDYLKLRKSRRGRGRGAKPPKLSQPVLMAASAIAAR